MRVAIAGKGGVGKSVVAGTLARLRARAGEQVLALDSDPMPGLALSLGAEAPDAPLADAVVRGADGRWRLRPGIGPVRAVQRYAVVGPDGVRLLQAAKVPSTGASPMPGAAQGFREVSRRIGDAPAFRGWTLIGDLSAGPRQFAYDWAEYAHTIVVLAEPTWQSALTARRILRIARLRATDAVLVATKVRSPADAERVGELVGEPPFATLAADAEIAQADREGTAPIDHAPAGAVVQAISMLGERLASRR